MEFVYGLWLVIYNIYISSIGLIPLWQDTRSIVTEEKS